MDELEKKEGKEDSEQELSEFEICTLEEVESWDSNKIGDYIGWLFRDKQYDDCRDKYVAIFMNLMIDGKKFMQLERRQISHMGIVTVKGKRHVSVIKNAQRHIKQRLAK